MTTVFKVVAGATVHYIRATSAAGAKVRAYKVFGDKAPTVTPMGHYAPDIGAAGYSIACRTVDAYKAPQHAPTARSMAPREAASVDANMHALASFLGLAQ